MTKKQTKKPVGKRVLKQAGAKAQQKREAEAEARQTSLIPADPAQKAVSNRTSYKQAAQFLDYLNDAYGGQNPVEDIYFPLLFPSKKKGDNDPLKVIKEMAETLGIDVNDAAKLYMKAAKELAPYLHRKLPQDFTVDSRTTTVVIHADTGTVATQTGKEPELIVIPAQPDEKAED